MLEKNLSYLGLNEKEIKIYISLLKTGTNKASFIARNINLPKTTVLDALNTLTKKRFISKIHKQNAYYFTAFEPDKILQLIDEEEDELKKKKGKIKNIIPLLENLQDIKSPKPQIEYLEGKQGLAEAFTDTLKVPNKNILCYATVDEQAYALPEVFPEYFYNRVKKKISTTCLIPASKPSLAECILKDEEQLRKTYFIPEDKYVPIEINVYENNTAIMSFEEEFAVIIRSKPIADSMKVMFDLAFEGAKKYDKEVRDNVDINELKEFYKKWKVIRKTPSAQKKK
ncbi:MAG: helix-turn-helix domain-containing protein [Patescibacteria group bacterium]